MTNKRIVVIDDDDGVREIIQISLEAAAGWDVIPASSGQEGIEQAASQQPDAILLDMMMPGMDGKATYQALQANPLTQNIPTILLTAKAKNSEKQQFIEDLGVTGVITKPFDAMGLVQQICWLLNWSEI
ncbi:response regulator [Roseofilum reptotaenium CS-1145]|uniref:Two-component system response regulator n=1 Tax=Roseofilum reptotaenium AO1-A TaxID=1925591 RepID=A0A1L9QNL5_9CYAN|nr:response regulator [Roseofilum reptotaenium]MDB9517078.1 response regulator [Roseofilum reptotaenium CS-1145]OJJ24177.1 two-component system response regulator [Roseofilum reptotaenium AO1-A]